MALTAAASIAWIAAAGVAAPVTVAVEGSTVAPALEAALRVELGDASVVAATQADLRAQVSATPRAYRLIVVGRDGDPRLTREITRGGGEASALRVIVLLVAETARGDVPSPPALTLEADRAAPLRVRGQVFGLVSFWRAPILPCPQIGIGGAAEWARWTLGGELSFGGRALLCRRKTADVETDFVEVQALVLLGRRLLQPIEYTEIVALVGAGGGLYEGSIAAAAGRYEAVPTVRSYTFVQGLGLAGVDVRWRVLGEAELYLRAAVRIALPARSFELPPAFRPAEPRPQETGLLMPLFAFGGGFFVL